MTSLPKNNRRKRFTRDSVEEAAARLSPRARAILNAIHSCGGVMSTLAVAMDFFPPDLDAGLRYWGLSQEEITQLRADYSDAELDACLKMLKFLRTYQHLRTNPPRITAAQTRIQTWLRDLYEYDPESFAYFDRLADRLNNLTPRAWLLKTLGEHSQIPDVFYQRPTTPSEFISSACHRCLRRLYDAGWLDKDEIVVKSEQGSGLTLWYLSNQTRVEMAASRGIAVADLPWKPVGSYGQLHVAHRLAINNVRLAITLAAKRLGYEIKQWLDEDDLRRVHSKQPLTIPADPSSPEGKQINRYLVPDSFFWLDTGKNWFHFFEVDRATETLHYADPSQDLNFWSRKVHKYGQYFKQYYASTYPEAEGKGRILVVTTSQTRLENMARVCSQAAGEKASGRYWFTLYSRIKPTYDQYFSTAILTDPIWQRADRLTHLQPLVW